MKEGKKRRVREINLKREIFRYTERERERERERGGGGGENEE